jgi:uncharacterized protein (DUF2062 family)
VPSTAFSSQVVRSRLARWLDRLLHLHDTPVRTAAAFALGVFFSFSPFLGFQILLSMLLAVLFRLNRVAVFVGLNANLPWFIVPWYVGTTLIAASVLGVATPSNAAQIAQLFGPGWSPMSVFEQAVGLVTPVFVPFILGSTAGAAVVAVVAFVVARAVLVRRVRGDRAKG